MAIYMLLLSFKIQIETFVDFQYRQLSYLRITGEIRATCLAIFCLLNVSRF